MPRVRRQKASGRARRVCGALGCAKEIPKGVEYYTWSFRGTGRQVRCLDHPPKPSDLTQSKLSTVYAAQESAGESLAAAENLEDIKAAVTEVAEAAREVMDEYREASESFGGMGQNAERADELEGWIDEMDNFEPEEDTNDEQFDEDEVGPQLSQEMFGIDDPEDLDQKDLELWASALQEKREEFEEGHYNSEEILEGIRAEAQELIDQCPL